MKNAKFYMPYHLQTFLKNTNQHFYLFPVISSVPALYKGIFVEKCHISNYVLFSIFGT